MRDHQYFVYITTNPECKVLYIGVTNDLEQRVTEHFMERGKRKTFAGRYYCYNLIYFEDFNSIEEAIDREKEIKKWRREKKDALIRSQNPEWKVLNEEYISNWPPIDPFHRKDEL